MYAAVLVQVQLLWVMTVVRVSPAGAVRVELTTQELLLQVLRGLMAVAVAVVGKSCKSELLTNLLAAPQGHQHA
jgi:hypothetical protein